MVATVPTRREQDWGKSLREFGRIFRVSYMSVSRPLKARTFVLP